MITNFRKSIIRSNLSLTLKKLQNEFLLKPNFHSLSNNPSSNLNTQEIKNMGKKRKTNEITEESINKMTPKYQKKYNHAPIYMQIIKSGSDTRESAPSLLLVFDKYKILFNTGPGILRYFAEKKIRISRLNKICFTRLSIEAITGLPSVFLSGNRIKENMNSSNEAKESQLRIDINAPLKLDYFVTNLIEYFRNKDLKLNLNNFGQKGKEGQILDPIIKDEQVKISPIFIMPKFLSTTTTTNKLHLNIQDEDKLKPAAIYICEFSEIKGKFKPEKAKELKVNLGPDFGRLKDGEAVLNQDGEIVHPSDVMEASTPGAICIIIDCPDESYFYSLSNSEGLKKWLENEIEQDIIIFHLSPFDVIKSDYYLNWIEKFDKKIEHLFVDQQGKSQKFILRKSLLFQYKLNMIDKHIFPLPKLLNSLKKEVDMDVEDLTKYIFKPITKKGIDNSEINGIFEPEKIVEQIKKENEDLNMIIKNYKKLKEEIIKKETYPIYKDDIERSKIIESIDHNDIAITFLGTGAAAPSIYRNVSGMYIDFFARGSMIVDCGDGTYGQLVKKFGEEGTVDALKKLKCVWISHRHEDHHLGLSQILIEHYKLISKLGAGSRPDPVLIIGTSLILHNLKAQLHLENAYYKFLLIRDTISKTDWVNTNKTLIQQGALKLYSDVKKQLDLLSLTSFSVHHCSQAYGLVLEGMKGWKVVYSGDTRPCDNLIKYGQKATLLIHEATFEDELIEEAKIKKHSTVSEAIDMANKCNAYRTILTHFSQRYPAIPCANYKVNDSIVIAFDFMTVNLGNLSYLPLIMDPCTQLLKLDDYKDDMDNFDPALSVKYVI